MDGMEALRQASLATTNPLPWPVYHDTAISKLRRVDIDVPGGQWIEVFLDGVKVDGCIEADVVRGWVRVYEKNNDGTIMMSKGITSEPRFLETVRYGKVELRPIAGHAEKVEQILNAFADLS